MVYNFDLFVQGGCFGYGLVHKYNHPPLSLRISCAVVHPRANMGGWSKVLSQACVECGSACSQHLLLSPDFTEAQCAQRGYFFAIEAAFFP